MIRIFETLFRWLRAVADAYHRAMQLTQPDPPAAPPPPVSAAPEPTPPPPRDEPPVVRRRRTRPPRPEPPSAPPAPPPPPAAATPAASALPPEDQAEAALARLESGEPALENMGEIIRQRKRLAQLQDELEALKSDARAAERLARIRENLARAARFEERMQSYLQANQVRAAQRKAEIEADLLRNEQKIRELDQERARLARTRKQEDLARLEALEKSMLELSLANDDLISEKAALAGALVRPADAAAPVEPGGEARLANVETSIEQNIRRLAELETERQELLRSRDPAVADRLREISDTIQTLSAQGRSARLEGGEPAAPDGPRTAERKREIEALLQEHAARISSLEEERTRLLQADVAQAADRLREIESSLRDLKDARDILVRERDMIIRALTPPPRPVPLGQDQMVHLSAIDDHKREAKIEAQREAERHEQIITEQKARARERAEREAALLRKRAAEIEAQREANIRARLEGGAGRPPAAG